MAKKEIFVEEAILDDMSEGLEHVEMPLSFRSFIAFGIIVSLFVAIVFAQLFSLNIISGDKYKVIAMSNSGQLITERAPRGVIYDRFGNPLVKNEPSFFASVNLSEILKHPNKISSEISAVSSIIDINSKLTVNKILSANLEKESQIPLAKNLSLEQSSNLNNLGYKWLLIKRSFLRKYLGGYAFSHLLGYTGFATEKDIKNNASLNINSIVGKAGLEAIYNNKLTGTEGISVVFKDANGKIIEEKQKQIARSGDSIITSIDGALQEYFYKAFKKQLEKMGITKGAGIIMNPNTGEILSIISMPSYNNNHLSSSLFINKDKPMFDRAVSGVYSPGSTIKPLVGIGVLSEKLISPLASIFSPGYLYLPNPYDPKHPSKFLDWRYQGWVNMYSAIAKSSDVYFYEVGGGYKNQKGLGIKRLKEYWEKFMLNKKTGIDLPNEKFGLLPDPLWKKDTGRGTWRIGDTYNVTIGQGSLMITPIELLRYIASVADHGKLPVPFIASKIVNSKGKVDFVRSPKFNNVNVKDMDAFNVVERGMIDGVSKEYGTAHMLASIPMVIAAKTGSAQISNNTETNAFFVGYNIPKGKSEAKSDIKNIEDGNIKYIPKQIAVLILVENAKEGSLNAVPIAKDVFQWYYKNRIIGFLHNKVSGATKNLAD